MKSTLKTDLIFNMYMKGMELGIITQVNIVTCSENNLKPNRQEFKKMFGH